MRQMVKRMLTGLLAAAMLLTPALAAGEETPAQQLSPWAYDAVADCYAMGLMDDNYGAYILDPVTDEQLDQLTGVVGDKLALLGVPVR